MIFMCVTKVSKRYFWTKTRTNASDYNRPLSCRSKQIVYLVSEYCLKNKEDSQTPYLKWTAEATGVSRATLRVSEMSETGR